MNFYILEPVGFIRSPVKGREDAPRQGPEGAPDAWLEIEPRFAEALLSMEVGNELIVITWLHEAKRDVLKGHPRNDPNRPLTGVFYTRSPSRPNPLGLHPVTVRAIEGTRIKIGPIEAFDGTPVVDIKSASTRGRRMIGIKMKRSAMRMYIVHSLALAIGGAALAQTPSPNEKK